MNEDCCGWSFHGGNTRKGGLFTTFPEDECLPARVLRQERNSSRERGAWSANCSAAYLHPNRRDVTRSDDVSRQPVLIFSSDPLAAALLAAAVELAGHSPHFAQKGESARDALRRVRPRLLLIDCDHEESCSDELIGPALMMQAVALIFSSQRSQRDMRLFADRLGVRMIQMPMQYDELSAILRELLTQPEIS